MLIPNFVQDHVETIAKHEQDFLASRTNAERLGDVIATFAGSFSFVVLHIACFTLWITINTTNIRTIPHFDPTPFALLDTCVALEAILLASFILMRAVRTGQTRR